MSNKTIAKNTVFLYFRLIFTLFISIYTTRVILSNLGVMDYGIYSVVCGFVALFSFINSSLSNGIQRFYNYESGKNGETAIAKVYKTAIVIQVILALLILIIVEPLGIWYVNYQMQIPTDRIFAANCIFQFSLVSLLFLIFQIPYSAVIMSYEKMGYYATVGIIDVVLKLAIILLLPLFQGDRLIIYGLLLLLVTIIDFILYFSYAKFNFKILNSKFSFDKNLFRDVFKFSGWNFVEMFAWTTQGQGVNIVLNLFCGPIVNAAQGISIQIQGALNGFCANLVMAYRPQLVQSYAQNDIHKTCDMMYSMSKIMFLMFFMLAVPVILEIDYILKIWLGKDIPDYTSSFTVLILLSIIPRNFAMGLSQVVHATGRLKNYQLGSALIVILVLPISYILLKNGYTPDNIYIANLLLCILLWIADLYLLSRIFPLSIKDYLKKVVIPSSLIFVLMPIMPMGVHMIFEESFIRLILVGMSSGLVAMILGYWILLNKSERTSIRNFIIKKLFH